MAELLSVQIHVPSMWAGPTAGGALPGAPGTTTTGARSVLKKVDNRTVQASRTTAGGPVVTLKHLPKRRPIDIEFKDLTYSVSEGRKRGMILSKRSRGDTKLCIKCIATDQMGFNLFTRQCGKCMLATAA